MVGNNLSVLYWLVGASAVDFSAGKSVAQLVLWSLYFLCFCYYYGARAAAYRKSVVAWGLVGGLLSVAVLVGVVLAVTVFAELYEFAVNYGIVFSALVFAVVFTAVLARLLINQRDHPVISVLSVVFSIVLLSAVYPKDEETDIRYKQISTAPPAQPDSKPAPVSSSPDPVVKQPTETGERENSVVHRNEQERFPPDFGKVRSTVIRPGEGSRKATAHEPRTGGPGPGGRSRDGRPASAPVFSKQENRPGDLRKENGSLTAKEGLKTAVPSSTPPKPAAKAVGRRPAERVAEDDLIARIITARRPGDSRPAVNWVVQVASFSKRRNAFSLRDRLKQDGFKAFIAAESGAGRYRVRIGPVVSRTEADRLRMRLAQQHKLRGIVLKYR